MRLNHRDCQLVESPLNAGAHEHFDLFRLSTDLHLELVCVIFGSNHISRDLEQALQILEIFSVWVLKADPLVLDRVLVLKVDGRQVILGHAHQLVFDPATIVDSNGDHYILGLLRGLYIKRRVSIFNRDNIGRLIN